MFDQRGELPLLPFGNPIGFVPASRGGAYIGLTPRLGGTQEENHRTIRDVHPGETRNSFHLLR
ncbi:MAG: hypothetical protein V3W08_09420, partial [Candidatus Binatia bacterium]